MPLTLGIVRDALEAEEPDYAMLAVDFGPPALPHLEQLTRSPDIRIAAKAVYLAAMIAGPLSASILQTAAQLSDPRMRIAATAAAIDLGAPAAREIWKLLLTDPDPGVKRLVLTSVAADRNISMLIPVAKAFIRAPIKTLRGISHGLRKRSEDDN